MLRITNNPEKAIRALVDIIHHNQDVGKVAFREKFNRKNLQEYVAEAVLKNSVVN